MGLSTLAGYQTMVGGTVAGYRILSLLGRDSTASLYLARRYDGPPVALRLLHPEIAADADRRERLLLQARAARRLRHPAPARVLELIETPPLAGVVYELIEGETLADRLLAGGVSAAEALRVALEAAAAMEEAHDKQVPHGPLDASHLVIDARERIRIMDLCPGDSPHGPSCLGPLLREIAPASPAISSHLLELLESEGGEPAGLASGLRILHQQSREADRRSRRRARSVAAIASLAAVGLLLFAATGTSSTDAARAPGTLAVLPFQQLDDLAGRLPAGFGLSVADSVITSLSRVPCIQVRPTALVERFAGRPIDPVAAGRALGVDTVLWGEIVAGLGSSTVWLRLQDVRTGASEWEATLSVGWADDPFQLQVLVAQTVLDHLGHGARTTVRA